MLRIVLAGLLALGLAAPRASAAESSQIIVMGVGSAERPADWAEISLSARGEGKTAVEALRALTKVQARLQDGVGSLAGATGVRIDTSELKMAEVRGDGCDVGESYEPKAMLSDGACAIKGHIATLSMKVRVLPAGKAGDAASLAAELGGTSVELDAFGLNDPAALADAATRAAIENARAQALSIAKASGATLGAIVRVQDPTTMEFEFSSAPKLASRPAERPVDRTAPTVTVEISVPPVKEMARLTVVFALER